MSLGTLPAQETGLRPGQRSARVLIVNAQQDVRTAIAEGLRLHGFAIEAHDEDFELELAIARHRPHVVIVDADRWLQDSRLSIVECAEVIGPAGLVCTSASSDLDVMLAAFAAGSDDFLSMPFSLAELIARVHALVRRLPYEFEPTFAGTTIELDRRTCTASRAGASLDLTPIEFRLLAVLVNNPAHAFSKTQLLDLVWGSQDSSVNLVEVHIHSLRHKLEAHGARVIQTIRARGYLFSETAQ